jgi:hypothetical protein
MVCCHDAVKDGGGVERGLGWMTAAGEWMTARQVCRVAGYLV